MVGINMARIAVLASGNVVANVIEADSVEAAEEITGATCVISADARHGQVFDETTREFSDAVVVVEETPAETPAPTSSKK